MIMMLTLMLWLPYQITQLVEMYVTAKHSLGKLPAPWHDFVCLFACTGGPSPREANLTIMLGLWAPLSPFLSSLWQYL